MNGNISKVLLDGKVSHFAPVTQGVEVNPGSSLLVVCVVRDLSELLKVVEDETAKKIKDFFSPLVNGQVEVIVSDVDLRIDFYRIDPIG